AFHRVSFFTAVPRTMAAAFSTFSSKVADFIKVASAHGTSASAMTTPRAITRLFAVIRYDQKQSIRHHLFQATTDELAYDSERLRRDLMPHRKLVIFDGDSMLLEHA